MGWKKELLCWWVFKTPDSVALRLMSTLLNFDFTALHIFVLLSSESFNVASPRSAWQESITMFHPNTPMEWWESKITSFQSLLECVRGCFLWVLIILYSYVLLFLFLWRCEDNIVTSSSLRTETALCQSKLVVLFALWDFLLCFLQSSVKWHTPHCSTHWNNAVTLCGASEVWKIPIWIRKKW